MLRSYLGTIMLLNIITALLLQTSVEILLLNKMFDHVWVY